MLTIRTWNYLDEKLRKVSDRIDDDRGEVASWLVLAAGLVAAAFAAGGRFTSVFDDLVSAIVSAAGGGGGGGGPIVQ